MVLFLIGRVYHASSTIMNHLKTIQKNLKANTALKKAYRIFKIIIPG